MMEFEVQTETSGTAEDRMRLWLAKVRVSDGAVFQKIMEVAYWDVPQEIRLQIASTFPEEITRKQRGMRMFEPAMGKLVLYAEQTEREISSLEELANEENTIAEAVATLDADLAAIMTPSKLGDL